MANTRRTRTDNVPTINRRSAPKWTPEEEDILIDEIGKNPTNLAACFLACSRVINRSAGACSSHWYTKMVNSENPALLTIGRTSVIKNRKRLKEGQHPTGILRSSWNFIIDLIFGNRR